MRSEWLLDERITFLNHGSFGAVPRRVLDAQTEWRRKIEADPIEILGRQGMHLIAAAKQVVGDWLRMQPHDFGFVSNATEGVNAVLRSLQFNAGDELLTTTHVYNAVRQAMKYIAERAGASYREIDVPLPIASREEVARVVLNGISSRTRLVVIDHVTSPTALVFPVEQIAAGCAGRGIDVLIDGAHAPGMLPLNVSQIGAAYYAGNLHKWACSPKGSGFLWVRADKQPGIHPTVISHHLGEGFAREFGWQGTRDISAWLAVPSALNFMAELGWERVMHHNHALAAWAQRMLCEQWEVEPISPPDGSMLGSMASVAAPPEVELETRQRPSALPQFLRSEKCIEVPVMEWGGKVLLRPCCQVYNVPSDYERLAEGVKAFARTL